MKKYLFQFFIFAFSLGFLLTSASDVTFAAQQYGQICKGSGQGNCASGLVCKIANPQECATIGNKDPAACKTTCQKQLSKKDGACKTTADCNNGLICTLINATECSQIGAKDPHACDQWCQPAPPVKQGGKCDSVTYKCDHGLQCVNGTCQPACNADGQACSEGATNSKPCPAGYYCQHTDPNCLHLGICDGTCQLVPNGVCDKKKTTPTPTPLPPPPSPPCSNWNGGQCSMFDSALGSLSTNPSQFIVVIFAILLSIAGGLAILLIIKAGYQMMTSQGKPEQLQQGRDQLIAAIVGLVFLIFSFVLLQLIGFDILHIPGFGP